MMIRIDDGICGHCGSIIDQNHQWTFDAAKDEEDDMAALLSSPIWALYFTVQFDHGLKVMSSIGWSFMFSFATTRPCGSFGIFSGCAQAWT